MLYQNLRNLKTFDARIGNKHIVSFGETGASDYTKHKDPQRIYNYINRHNKNEDWTKSAVKAAGWMSKHVLWNKQTLQASVADINKAFTNINVKMK